jgi:hypothetical protein
MPIDYNSEKKEIDFSKATEEEKEEFIKYISYKIRPLPNVWKAITSSIFIVVVGLVSIVGMWLFYLIEKSIR